MQWATFAAVGHHYALIFSFAYLPLHRQVLRHSSKALRNMSLLPLPVWVHSPILDVLFCLLRFAQAGYPRKLIPLSSLYSTPKQRGGAVNMGAPARSPGSRWKKVDDHESEDDIPSSPTPSSRRGHLHVSLI
jgi:hypothetical protein